MSDTAVLIIPAPDTPPAMKEVAEAPTDTSPSESGASQGATTDKPQK